MAPYEDAIVIDSDDDVDDTAMPDTSSEAPSIGMPLIQDSGTEGYIHSYESIDLPAGSKKIEAFSQDGFRLTPGMSIQYPIKEKGHNNFFSIREMYKDTNQMIYLQGWSLELVRRANGMLLKKRNELAVCFTVSDSRTDPDRDRCRSVIQLPKCCWERKIIYTNVPAPTLREYHRRDTRTPALRVRETGILYCRWFFIQKVRATDSKEQEIVVQRFNHADCHGSDTADRGVYEQWRGADHPGVRSRNIASGKYLYGDAFTGGGGTLRAAVQAEFSLRFALDYEGDCIRTLEANEDFADAQLIQVDVGTWAMQESTEFRVHILHISPPCQGFSGKNRGGQNDDQNRALILVVAELLKKTRPRIATLEQVAALKSHRRWREYYCALINEFTRHGYSVRARVEKMSDYGNAQVRERLIIIASCPGEPLPTFPEPTHQNKIVTINDVLRALRRRHYPANMAIRKSLRETPYNGNVRKPCILTGSQGVHPSGKRAFYLYELAAFQGFPPNHKFVGNILKQIGNAVDVGYGRILFTHIRKCLEQTDLKRAQDWT